jgi:hypothetical protein
MSSSDEEDCLLDVKRKAAPRVQELYKGLIGSDPSNGSIADC